MSEVGHVGVPGHWEQLARLQEPAARRWLLLLPRRTQCHYTLWHFKKYHRAGTSEDIFIFLKACIESVFNPNWNHDLSISHFSGKVLKVLTTLNVIRTRWHQSQDLPLITSFSSVRSQECLQCLPLIKFISQLLIQTSETVAHECWSQGSFIKTTKRTPYQTFYLWGGCQPRTGGTRIWKHIGGKEGKKREERRNGQ